MILKGIKTNNKNHFFKIKFNQDVCLFSKVYTIIDYPKFSNISKTSIAVLFIKHFSNKIFLLDFYYEFHWLTMQVWGCLHCVYKLQNIT